MRRLGVYACLVKSFPLCLGPSLSCVRVCGCASEGAVGPVVWMFAGWYGGLFVLAKVQVESREGDAGCVSVCRWGGSHDVTRSCTLWLEGPPAFL